MLRSDSVSSIQHAAFFFGSEGGILEVESSGSRVAFVETSLSSAESLRTTTSWLTKALFDHDYAAALGNSDASVDDFDIECFFKMLLEGGSLIEAFAISIAHLDYTAVPVGLPLTTARFPKHGYKVYRGIGGSESIDWQNHIAYTRHDQTNLTIPLQLTTGQRHIFGVRAVSQAGVEEHNSTVLAYAEVDTQGDLLPQGLSAPCDITAAIQVNGSLLLGFSYDVNPGHAQATSFELVSDFGTGTLDLDNPAATISDFRDGQSEFEVLLDSPTLPAKFAARAKKDQQVGPLSRIIAVDALATPQPPIVL